MLDSSSLALLRLLQLANPTLPIGAFAYSQGMEHAVHVGWIKDEATTRRWIRGILLHNVVSVDVPLLARFHRAWACADDDAVVYWSHWLAASRESKELQTEDQQVGRALARLLVGLGYERAMNFAKLAPTSFAASFAYGAVCFEVPITPAAQGYVSAWLDHQIATAIKLIPLGQSAGQRVIHGLLPDVLHAVQDGVECSDDDMGASAPGLAMGSALHETQYSRLFLS